MELNSTHTLSNCTVSTILVRYKIVELGNDRWVVRIWIAWVCRVVNHWLTRISPRDQIMEDPQPISAI